MWKGWTTATTVCGRDGLLLLLCVERDGLLCVEGMDYCYYCVWKGWTTVTTVCRKGWTAVCGRDGLLLLLCVERGELLLLLLCVEGMDYATTVCGRDGLLLLLCVEGMDYYYYCCVWKDGLLLLLLSDSPFEIQKEYQGLEPRG